MILVAVSGCHAGHRRMEVAVDEPAAMSFGGWAEMVTWITSAQRPSRDQPLIAPAVSPRTTWRCTVRYSKIGSRAKTTPAASS
jgi:hypothetical protein